jgi:hypothetical protein
MNQAGPLVSVTIASTLCFATTAFDALGAGELEALGAGFEVLLIGERTLGLRHLEELLIEVWHLAVAVAVVEVDQLGEGAVGFACGDGREIGVEVGLELIEQDFELGVAAFTVRGEIGGVNDDGSGLAQDVDAAVQEAIRGRVLLVELRAMPRRAPLRPLGSRKRV